MGAGDHGRARRACYPAHGDVPRAISSTAPSADGSKGKAWLVSMKMLWRCPAGLIGSAMGGWLASAALRGELARRHSGTRA